MKCALLIVIRITEKNGSLSILFDIHTITIDTIEFSLNYTKLATLAIGGCRGISHTPITTKAKAILKADSHSH